MESNSNKTIVNFFAEKISYVIKTYFPSNFVARFISFHSMLIDSGVQNPFAIVNTDGSVENDTHWWSFLNLHPQK